jgi:hypothetical protein
MVLIKRECLKIENLPGREVQKCVGKDGLSQSSKLTVGFARYSAESGVMEPHHHAEEVVYIVSSHKGWFRYGPDTDRLGEKIILEPGMTIHFKELEWHAFGFEEGGHVEIVFIYGQVDNIRPEEIIKDNQIRI